MIKSLTAFFLLLSALFVLAAAGHSRSGHSRTCRGKATYALIFWNFITASNFRRLIPEIPDNGLVYSPPVAVSHAKSVSLITVGKPATSEVEEIAETGNNMPLADLARSLVSRGQVRDVDVAMGPTMAANYTILKVTVDCKRPLITMTGMIAPSPDWLVQVSNRNMVNKYGKFIKHSFGRLRAYDAGTDSGDQLTDPGNPALDIPTVPAGPLRLLEEDETDRFDGRTVGYYKFVRIR